MKILITGGCGFIGTNLSAKLLAGRHEITVLDKDKRKDERIKFLQADITKSINARLMENGHDALVHLAAKSDARNMGEMELFKRINIDGTINVLEAARKNDIRKVIFASSSHVYGRLGGKKFSESGPINPVSHYGGTKFLGEMFCKAYSEFYGIDCIVLRLFTVYGHGGRTDMAVMKFTQSIDRGEPIEVHGKGKIKKDMVYIDDVSDGVIRSLDTKIKFEVINIGSGKATELSRLVALIEKELGKKAKIKPVEMQAGDTPYSCADISKAKKLLKWEPKVSIKDGIKKTVEWWKNQKLYSEANK